MVHASASVLEMRRIVGMVPFDMFRRSFRSRNCQNVS